MTIYYTDSSALVKRYLREANTEEVVRLVEQSTLLGSIILTRVEMASAFQKAIRMGWTEQTSAMQAWQDFLRHWAESFVELQVSAVVAEKASNLAWTYGLRGYDAVHFAAALLWQDALNKPVTLATFDRDLWEAGRKAGMQVWPQELV